MDAPIPETAKTIALGASFRTLNRSKFSPPSKRMIKSASDASKGVTGARLSGSIIFKSGPRRYPQKIIIRISGKFVLLNRRSERNPAVSISPARKKASTKAIFYQIEVFTFLLYNFICCINFIFAKTFLNGVLVPVL